MKLIIGLGNPGKKYQNTRHNLGFFIVEKLHQRFKNSFSSFKFEKKFDSQIATGKIKGEKAMLAMPQTFMNNSGQAATKLAQFYKLNFKKDILIIYDDIDLPLGKIRSSGKSAGGHKGMDSIIQSFGTKNIKRIRCGILGKPKNKIKNAAAYVLQSFIDKELEIISKEVMPQVILEIEKFLKD
ncbi:MAG: aminoacyl-tRNA hydrolase [Patescibacteria group bacterium]